jgi:hypothetical protein
VFLLSPVNPRHSALCLIQLRHPSTTLKEQVLSIEEIAVRTPEGIHRWTENLDIENGITAGSSEGVAPALNDKLGL